jgi:peptide-methionine (R)-S-oxide reductase
MMSMKTAALAALLALGTSCAPKPEAPPAEPPKAETPRPETPKTERAAEGDSRVKNPLGLSDEEWKKKLSAEEYYVCRQQGTERPGTGKLLHYKGDGTFVCAACGNPLFDSKAKFESGTGWPSFYQPLSKDAVTERGDLTHGMTRVEVNCSKCGSHLGHVFDDGPQPTGLRYCMNSVSLKVKEKDEKK